MAERVSDDASNDAEILEIEEDGPVVLGEAAEGDSRSGQPATVPHRLELPTEAWTAATPRRQDAFVLIQCVLGALSLLSVWSSATQVALALAALLVLIALIPLGQRVRNGSGRAKVRALGVLVVALAAIAAGSITVIRLATSDPSLAPSVEVDARTFSVDSEMRTSNRTGLASQSVTATTGETVEWTIRADFGSSGETEGRVRIVYPRAVSPVLSNGLAPAGDGVGVVAHIGRTSKVVSVSGLVSGAETLCGDVQFLTVLLEGKTGILASSFTPLVILDEEMCQEAEQGASGRFYPGDRQYWDWNTDRTGPSEFPVLNSYINTPSYGDERSFLDARPVGATDSGSFHDLTAVSPFGDRVVVRLFAVNSANENVEPRLTAHETTARILVPAGTANSLRVRGYISSSDARPDLVENTTDFTSGSPFRLVYVSGSARMYTRHGEFVLPDQIVDDGVLIGSASAHGNLEPGADEAVVIEIELIVLPS